MNLLEIIHQAGLEPDQRLMQAIIDSSSRDVSDFHIFLALYRLNSIATRKLSLDLSRLSGRSDVQDYRAAGCIPVDKSDSLHVSETILKKIVAKCSHTHTLGTRDFFRALLQLCEEHGDDYRKRPWTLDALMVMEGLDRSTPLSRLPGVVDLISELATTNGGEEDFQYLLGFSEGRLVFRVASVLDDYVQERSTGLLVPQRALLTHFKDQFGGFTSDEIEELEALLNNSKASELDYQRFFEMYPHFFRQWDYREVFPQITLTRPEGPLIPDFILTDRDLQKSAILDLKLPTPKLVARRRNRERFSSAIMEARTQLLRYRDWFRDAANRRSLAQKVGMEVYEPHLIVVVGRAAEFHDAFDRQRLRADNPDIEVVTYDDIITYAHRRRLLVES